VRGRERNPLPYGRGQATSVLIDAVAVQPRTLTDGTALPVPGGIVAAGSLSSADAPLYRCSLAFHAAKDAAWDAYDHNKETA